MLQAVALFLIAMVLLGVVGKWRRKRVGPTSGGKSVEAARKCRTCDAYVFGRQPEACARPDCPNR